MLCVLVSPVVLVLVVGLPDVCSDVPSSTVLDATINLKGVRLAIHGQKTIHCCQPGRYVMHEGQVMSIACSLRM